MLYSSLRVILICRSFFDRAMYWSSCSVSTTCQSCSFSTALHATTYLERIVKVADFAQRVQEPVHPSLVHLDKRVQRGHISLFTVTRLVREILQHLGDQGQRPTRVLCWDAVDEHVRLRGDDGGIDEPEEEEPSDKRAECEFGNLWVFPLQVAISSLASKITVPGIDPYEPSSDSESACKSIESRTAPSRDSQ